MRSLRLELVEHGDLAGQWKVLAPVDREWRGRKIVVPVGFITDGPSIPRWARSILPVRGMMWPAALIHDWLYVAETEGWNRSEADQCFRDLLKADGMSRVARNIMYAAVRAGGGHLWGDVQAHRHPAYPKDENP